MTKICQLRGRTTAVLKLGNIKQNLLHFVTPTLKNPSYALDVIKVEVLLKLRTSSRMEVVVKSNREKRSKNNIARVSGVLRLTLIPKLTFSLFDVTLVCNTCHCFCMSLYNNLGTPAITDS